MKHYAQVFTDFNQGATDGWLKSQRIAAFARFEYLGFPSRKVEQWKYTSLNVLAKQQFQLATSYDLTAARQLLHQQGLQLDAYQLVFVDGLFCPELSNLKDLPSGVVIEPLSQALENELELTSGMLGRLAGIDIDAFTALNFAFVHEGAVIRLGREQHLTKPVLLTYLSVATEQQVMSHPRVAVAAGRGSSLQLIEHFISSAPAHNLTNRVAEIILEANTNLEHTLLQQAGEQDYWIGRVHTEQKRDSTYTYQHLNLGGKLVRDDLVNDLNGTGAASNGVGLLFGRNKQHLDAHTLSNHNAAHTNSEVTYKSILNDSARGVFNTRVVVKKDSQKIRAEQHNANLLLSDKAEIDTKPELEIYADDVQCAHGATTGQLDADALFYLQARGIEAEHARGLLILAFANEVVNSLHLPAIQSLVERQIAGYLPYKIQLDTDL